MVCKVRSCLTVKIWQGLASLWQGIGDGYWLGQEADQHHSGRESDGNLHWISCSPVAGSIKVRTSFYHCIFHILFCREIKAARTIQLAWRRIFALKKEEKMKVMFSKF